MLQIAVGDLPLGAVSRDQALLDGRKEGLAPNVALAKVIIINPPIPTFAALVAPMKEGSCGTISAK